MTALDSAEMSGAVVEHQLEPGLATTPGGIPPALVQRPRPCPPRDAANAPVGPAQQGRGGGELCLPLTPTGSSFASSTTSGSGSAITSAGAGTPSRPGHGAGSDVPVPRGPAVLDAPVPRGPAVPNGRRCSKSAKRRPEPSRPTVTPSKPTRVWTRCSARSTRSSASDWPPQKPSWRPSSGSVSTTRSRMNEIPPVGLFRPLALRQPSSCQRTRSTTSGGLKRNP